MIRKMINNIDNQQYRKEIIKELESISLISHEEEYIELVKSVMQYPEGVEYFKENWKTIVNNYWHAVKLIPILAEDKDIREDVFNNLDYFIKYGNVINTAFLAREIARSKGGIEVIVNNFEKLLQNCFVNIDYLAIPALQSIDGRKKVKEHFLDIKDNSFPTSNANSSYTPEGFFNFIKALKGIEGFEKEYEEYIFWAELYDSLQISKPERTNDISYYIYQKRLYSNAKYLKNLFFSNICYSKDREEQKQILKIIANGKNYEFLKAGGYSIVMKVEDQIVKLGETRLRYKIPYHPRIMMPYFRKQYIDGSCLEVFNLGITDSPEITDEKLLEIYKELEDSGIRWTDARKENLLVLKSDNNLPNYIKGEDFALLGFLEDDENHPTNKHKVLKAGDIVICDLDLLYTQDDPNYKEGINAPIIVQYLRQKKYKKSNRNNIEFGDY